MSVDLFWHNKTAYQSAVAMLNTTGKAAVIHPTGTGKSFIALKLCEENPEKRVCWLSPSEYIFQTQIKNWNAALNIPDFTTKEKEHKIAGQLQENAKRTYRTAVRKNEKEAKKSISSLMLQNISFSTYAKLMRMEESALSEIKPDYIILDEFHRCGAAQWGGGVKRLCGMYPEAKVLGLSATSVRYLDNQRDMAWELFEGNIASELTLGEAIARGILPMPTYILSVYSYQKELKRCEAQIQRTKNSAVREKAEQQLEALRRALAQADGLEEIFAKYMLPTKIEEKQNRKENQEKNIEQTYGKYLVFCANYDHLNEMKELASEWFARVDAQPHIYTVYSEQPEAAQEFQAFQQDSSSHLKLLYCIDMLNEGIHLKDIDGVILLRPTVSPTIYKQQIGRALAAGKKKQPVIFDIVMNIENLYSIGAVEKELREAVLSYRALGREKELVNETFQIIDEVQDGRTLFAQLNETLGASWDMMYAMAKQYFEQYGTLEIPKRYRTPEGYSLGMWLTTQRKVYAGKVAGNLSKTQMEKLEKIGMKWQGTRELAWEKHYKEAVEYYNEHGHLLVGIQEIYNKKKEQDNENKESFIEDLTQKDTEKKEFQSCEKTENKDDTKTKFILKTFSTEQNLEEETTEQEIIAQEKKRKAENKKRDASLARWLARLRLERKRLLQEKTELQKKEESIEIREQNQNINLGTSLTSERIALLDEIGMVWDAPDFIWEQHFAAAEEYYKKYGSLDVPTYYVNADGIRLGKWVAKQRKLYQEKRNFLDTSLNSNDFTKNKALLESELTKERAKNNCCLTKRQKERLTALGMNWEGRRNTTWEKSYAAACKYYKEYNDLEVPAAYITADGFRLGRWIRQQREKYQKTAVTLQKENDKKDYFAESGSLNITQKSGTEKEISLKNIKRIQCLEQIGMVWENNSWERRFELAREYYKKHGNLDMPADYVVEGVWLGRWLREQKQKLEETLKKEQKQEIASERKTQNIVQDVQKNTAKWRQHSELKSKERNSKKEESTLHFGLSNKLQEPENGKENEKIKESTQKENYLKKSPKRKKKKNKKIHKSIDGSPKRKIIFHWA